MAEFWKALARKLRDPWGQTVDTKRLKDEQAGPTVTGTRPILSDHPAQGLNPSRLATLLRAAEEGDATAYLELAEDMEERDLHYRSVLGTRKLQVANLPITVEAVSDEPADVEIADMVRDLVASPPVQHALYDILDAIGKGFSVCEILWDTEGGTWRPREIIWRDPRWFEFDRVDGRTLLLRGGDGEDAMGKPLIPYKFIRHVHRTKSGLPIRGGLARPVSWYYLFKNFGIKDWIVFAEAYGHPLRVGKYDAQTASEEDKQVLLDAVRNIAADAGAIIPNGMLIEFIEAKIAGNIDLFERLVKFIDDQVSKGALGQTGTADSGPYTGTAQVQDGVREDIEKDDARQIAATLNRDLVRPFVDLNRGPQAAYPLLRIGRPDELDVKELRESLQALVPLGLRVGMSTVRDRLGLPDPDDDEDVLAAPAGTTPAPAPEDQEAAPAPAKTRRQVHDPCSHLSAGGDLGAAAVADDWEPLMAPMVDQVQAAFDAAEDFDDLLRRLDELAPDMDVDALAEHLGRMMAMANAAGQAGADLGDD